MNRLDELNERAREKIFAHRLRHVDFSADSKSARVTRATIAFDIESPRNVGDGRPRATRAFAAVALAM
jgi:hypothetical protein